MTLLLNNDDVRNLLTMQMTIDALDRSYRGTITGETVCRPRIDIEIPTRNPEQTYRWGTMEGGSSALGYFAIRMKSDIIYYTEYEGVRTEEKFASRPGLFCGLVMLFDVQNAEPLAIINEGYLQHFRVGADAGIGARHMAREDAHVVGMFGSGGMARSHVDAMRQVRSIDRIQVFSPTREHREAYAREMAEKYDIEVIAVDDPSDVCRGADIVCECTDAAQTVVMGRWLEPGTHITAIGSHFDPEVYERTDVSLRLGMAPAPVGPPQWATESGSVTYAAGPGMKGIEQTTKAHRTEARFEKVISLEDLLAGHEAGRTSREQITHSTRGNLQGAQFFAVGGAVYEAARASSVGGAVPTEWFLQDIRD